MMYEVEKEKTELKKKVTDKFDNRRNTLKKIEWFIAKIYRMEKNCEKLFIMQYTYIMAYTNRLNS
jgi:hypothetical protein